MRPAVKALPRWGDGIVGDAKPDYNLDLSLGGLAISRIELFKRKLALSDEYDLSTLDVLGVGGVWTGTKFRKQGNATALLERAHNFAKSFRLHGTVLFSLRELVPFYEKRGYVPYEGECTIEQPRDGGMASVHLPKDVVFLTNLDLDPYDVKRIDILGLPW